jgi:hypothetical protein
MKKKYYLILGLILFLACNDEAATNNVEIRIANVSDFNYENVIVNTSGGENNYGNLAFSEVSNYVVYDFAHRYAFVELQIQGNTYSFQPIDYDGENRLENGLYTYEISANNSSNSIELNITLKTN